MKSSLSNMVIVLSIITFISSASVGGVYILTKDIIAEANAQKFKDAIQTVLPEFDNINEEQMVSVEGFDKQLKIYEATKNDKTSGYAVETYATGFADEIALLVGFDTEYNINKISVLSQKETPGLGAKIANPQDKFVIQFEGKNPQEFKLAVKKDSGDIDAITASTITSRAFALAVERAYEAVKQLNTK